MAWTPGHAALRLCVVFSWLLTLPAAARAHGPLGARIAAVSQQISAEPKDAGLYVERAELYRRDGRPDRALSDLERAEVLAPGSTPIRLCRAQIALDAAKPADARVLLDTVLADEPGLRPALLLRARALSALGFQKDAVADLDRLIREAPRPAPEWIVQRAELLIDLGESSWDRALEGLDQGMAALGPVPAIAELAVSLEMRRARYDFALARLDRLRESSPERPTLMALRGDVLQRAGRRLEAWVAWSEALNQIENLPAGRRHAPATVALESRLRLALSSSGSLP
jgi:predicted Zn-dependent protease